MGRRWDAIDPAFGALTGGWAGGMGSFGSLMSALRRPSPASIPDKFAGAGKREPVSGRVTYGPRVARNVPTWMAAPADSWREGATETARMDDIIAAAELVEVQRAAERAIEDEAIRRREGEIRGYGRQVRGAERGEAQRQRALLQQFGTPEQRAEDIISLEAIRRARGR